MARLVSLTLVVSLSFKQSSHLISAVPKSQDLPYAEAVPPYDIAPSGSMLSSTGEVDIFDKRWDLACNVPSKDRLLRSLHLDADGKPTWQRACYNIKDPTQYERDGFLVDKEGPIIKVTNHSSTWYCPKDTNAGRLLHSNLNDLSIRDFGNQLVVFEHTMRVDDRSRPPPPVREDKKDLVQMESLPCNIWCPTGIDVHQVAGDGEELVLHSPKYLRLWNIGKEKLLWEKYSPTGEILCLSKKYVLVEYGDIHLIERRNGDTHGTFRLPLYPGFISFDKQTWLDPLVSSGGLIFLKRSPKVVYIFSVGERKVTFHIRESSESLEGPLLLRGGLDNLELTTIGQGHDWRIHKVEERVNRKWFMDKLVERM